MNKHERNLDHCLKCTICHTQCPVVAAYPQFPGPKQLGPELERLRLARGENEVLEIDSILTYCMNCKRCDMACPHGVKPAFYNTKNKQNLETGIQEKVRDWILAHNVWWGKIASKIPGFSNFALNFPLAKIGMSVMGLAERDLPSYRKINIKVSKEKKEKKVLYFPGCYSSFNEPEIIQATVNILEGCNYEVEIGKSDCCGMPVISNALLSETKRIAKKNIDIFLEYIEKGFKIVTSCTTCELMLKEEYGHILDGKEVQKVASQVWGVFELLEEEESLPFEGNKEKIKNAYYHIPCHLKAQGTGFPAVKFLKEFCVQNLKVSDDYCCGIAGSYGFKKEKHSLSMKIGEPLFNAIKEASPELVITDCGTCKAQIKDGTSLTVKHPLLVLESYMKNR